MSKSAPSVVVQQLLASRPNAPLPLPGVGYAEQVDAGELLVLAPMISEAALQALAQQLHQDGRRARVQRAGQWHGHELLRLTLNVLPTLDWCRQQADRFGIDLGLLPQSTPARLVLFDMDSTLITMEVIDELAKEAGSGEEVAAITEAAMRGELDFNGSLLRRVATLKGLSLTAVNTVKGRLQCNPGVPEFAAMARAHGVKLGLVSGGFLPFAHHIGQQLQFDYVRANTLLDDGQALTGAVQGEIVNAQVKARTLTELATQYQLPTDAIWAVGDGANDLLMLQAAGLGVAFRAKPKLRQAAQLALDVSDMRALAALQLSLLPDAG